MIDNKRARKAICCSSSSTNMLLAINSNKDPMGKLTIDTPTGLIGDVESVLLRAGLGRIESAELAEMIISNPGVGFKTQKLVRPGVDISKLVSELRRVGLVVRWSGEN
jgi:hypothetical protein